MWIKPLIFVIIFSLNLTSHAFEIPGFRRVLGFFGSQESEETLVGPLTCYREELAPNLESHAQCSESLCAESKTNSLYLTNETIEKNLTPELLRPFQNIKENLKSNLEGLIVNRRALLNLARERRANILSEFDKMEEGNFQRSARRLLDDYVGNFRWSTNQSNENLFFAPPTFSNTQIRGVESYANAAFAKRNLFPTVVRPEQSLEQQRTLVSSQIRDLISRIQNPEQRMTDITRRNTLEYLQLQLTHVNQFENQGLEHFVISIDNELRDFLQIGFNPELINEEALEFCSERVCKDTVKDLASQRLDTIFEDELDKGQSRFLQEKLSYCRSLYASAVLAKRERQAHNQLLTSTLNDFINSGLSSYSENTKQQFRTFALESLQEEQLMEEESPEELIRRFASQTRPPEFKPDRFFDDLGLLNESLGFTRTSFSGRFNPHYLCPSDFIAGVQAPLTSEGTLNRYNCHHFLMDRNIAAHELGHLLSKSYNTINWSFESREIFDVTRACAQNHYLEGNQNFAYDAPFDGDLITTEEDFADLIAFKTYEGPNDLLSCRFFKNVSNNPTPDDYRLISQESISKHSTPFFRLIQEALHKQLELPSSCQGILNSAKKKIRTEPCF
ncbi:MAG: hypothetical protein K9K67_08165 [Bacteriovoracaceae bacterium]|nr:hypothetical protein [Bacteriovoracaceae bacterium]